MFDTPSLKPCPKLSRLWNSSLFSVLLVVWILFMLAIYGVVRLLVPSRLAQVYVYFHRGCCWIFSMRCTVEGTLTEYRPSLYLSNHISYLDVFVLGSVIPGYFIAKSEVARWPVFGRLAKLQNTLFFERNGQKVRKQLGIMSSHFDRNGSLILFPEGTSTEGEHVEPFKSSLLQSLEHSDKSVHIQPVTIAYTHYKNQKMTRCIRDHYAWYAKMPFFSHFFNALGMATAEVKVILHEPVALNQFASRKACAHYCWQKVSDGLSASLARV